MPTVKLLNQAGSDLGTVDLNDELFGVEPNHDLVHQAVVRHLAGLRQGTHDTKTRGEVSGGGKKPWRQKGTGRARHGSTRSPIWRKGGVAWGPHPRSYVQSLPKKMRKLAIRVVLSDKVRNNKLVVLDKLELNEYKTKAFAEVFDKLALSGPSLFVLAGADDKVQRSANNLPYVKVSPWNQISVYDLLKFQGLVLTQGAVTAMEEAFL